MFRFWRAGLLLSPAFSFIFIPWLPYPNQNAFPSLILSNRFSNIQLLSLGLELLFYVFICTAVEALSIYTFCPLLPHFLNISRPTLSRSSISLLCFLESKQLLPLFHFKTILYLNKSAPTYSHAYTSKFHASCEFVLGRVYDTQTANNQLNDQFQYSVQYCSVLITRFWKKPDPLYISPLSSIIHQLPQHLTPPHLFCAKSLIIFAMFHSNVPSSTRLPLPPFQRPLIVNAPSNTHLNWKPLVISLEMPS